MMVVWRRVSMPYQRCCSTRIATSQTEPCAVSLHLQIASLEEGSIPDHWLSTDWCQPCSSGYPMPVDWYYLAHSRRLIIPAPYQWWRHHLRRANRVALRYQLLSACYRRYAEDLPESRTPYYDPNYQKPSNGLFMVTSVAFWIRCVWSICCSFYSLKVVKHCLGAAVDWLHPPLHLLPPPLLLQRRRCAAPSCGDLTVPANAPIGS